MEGFEWLVGISATIIGAVIGIEGYKRTIKKDDAEKVRNETRIELQLDRIGKNVEEIRLDNKDFSKTISKLNERVSSVETRVTNVEQNVEDLQKLHLNK